MNITNKAFFLCAASVLALESVRAQDITVNPTRPSVADNAYLTAFGYAEIEFGWSRAPSGWNFPTLLKATIARDLELGFTSTGLLTGASGSTTSTGTPGAQAKWQLTEGDWGAFTTVGHLDWPSDGPPAYTFYPVVSLKSEHAFVDFALGATFVRPFSDNRQSSYFYALAVAPDLQSNFAIYGELYGTFSKGQPVHAADIGVLYTVTPLLVIDCAVGTGITNNTDDWTFQIGLTTSLFRLF